ncbi:MAG TPA: DUF4162 domain-containing protein, partial [Nitrososphaerales archaeon]|nr:DUF4162 domain-containing protein [Nitrososphaerales archaeon]
GATRLRVEFEGGTVSVLLAKPRDALVVLNEVEKSGIQWRGFQTKECTLEDIFVKLVGCDAGDN